MLDHRPLCLLLPAVLALPAHAGAMASLELRVDGEVVFSTPLKGETNLNGYQVFAGSAAGDDWSLSYALESNGDPSADAAWVDGTLTLLNTSGASREFNLVVDVPVCPGVSGPTLLDGSVDLSVEADDDGALLYCPGGSSVYTVRADGAALASLLAGPFMLTASGAGSMSTDEAIRPVPGPVTVQVSVGLALSFRLSSGDFTELQCGFGVQPESGASFVACGGSSADLDGDGTVGVSDLIVMLSSWGDCSGCPADLDHDDRVAFTDVVILLNAWN